MDYDFTGLCFDQLEKLQKRLDSLNKAFIKEYKIALNVINNEKELENRSMTAIELENILSDSASRCKIAYKQEMERIEKVLERHL